MSTGLLKAIQYARGQLRHLRKYGDDEQRDGAGELDQWLEDLQSRNTPAPAVPAAMGFARRESAATARPPASS